MSASKITKRTAQENFGTSLIPPWPELLANFDSLVAAFPILRRVRNAVETGRFIAPDGRSDDMEVRLPVSSMAILAWLAARCRSAISVEVGFGQGSSAAAILAARRRAGHNFQHIVYDPFDLRVAAQLIRPLLSAEFGASFSLVKARSIIGVARLCEMIGTQTVDLIFIDGDHRFEAVMSDFAIADLLCAAGGVIVFDDAAYPATEVVLNYIATNRPDYTITSLTEQNTALIQKVGPDRREWYDFKPFAVPDRADWTNGAALIDIDNVLRTDDPC